MRQSDEADIIYIDRMLKYINAISDAYSLFNINNVVDFGNNYLCQLAVTQAITNIYEVRKKIQVKTLDKMPLFGRIRLKSARNIASHDYEHLDLGIIYMRTLSLIGSDARNELEATRDGLKPSTTSDNQS